MKKAIALFTVMFLLCGTIAGCAPDNASGNNTTGTGASSVSASGTDTFPAMEGMGNTPLNIRNQGYAVLGGGSLYYADRQNGGNIWRADPDGSNARKLAEGSFKNLNVSGGRLFFTDWTNIYVMPVDATEPQIIKKCNPEFLFVLDEWLYYMADYAVCRMKADGSEDKQLVKDVSDGFMIEGNWIYFLRDVEGEGYYHIWKAALDGSKSEQVSNARIQSKQLLIYENMIYFVDHEKVYGLDKMALDGTGRQEIYDGNVSLYNAADGWIYIQTKPTKNDELDIYKVKTDGSGLTKVTQGHCFDMSFTGEWVYFCTNDTDYRVSKMKLDGSERALI